MRGHGVQGPPDSPPFKLYGNLDSCAFLPDYSHLFPQSFWLPRDWRLETRDQELKFDSPSNVLSSRIKTQPKLRNAPFRVGSVWRTFGFLSRFLVSVLGLECVYVCVCYHFKT